VPLSHIRHRRPSHIQPIVPPQPSEMRPHAPEQLAGVQQAPPVQTWPAGQTLPHPPQLFESVRVFTHVVPPQRTLLPAGQQRPNIAGRELFLAMGFAQSRLQQLMSVEHCWPLGLQPPARASHAVLRTTAVLATSARRAVRQSGLASDMVGSTSGADARAHRGLKSTGCVVKLS
jgi:hypothetical protein